LIPLVFSCINIVGNNASAQQNLRGWVTTVDGKYQLSPIDPEILMPPKPPIPPDDVIRLDANERFQKILGLGSSFEPATCENLAKLPPADRTKVIRSLVHPTEGIGMNLMRICIGTPDFTGKTWASYDDLPPGETDPDLKRFSILRDRPEILPVLKEALAINKELRFFASPWSPPGWMKTTGSLIGGKLKREWYDAYARYFLKFIEAYEAEGIPILAVTVQNEPGVDRAKDEPKWHYPSCQWDAEDELIFIRDHLGPTLRKAGYTTEIWCYDHNFNEAAQPGDAGISYPITILADQAARLYVNSVAFHGYVGHPRDLLSFQRRMPRVPIHFTEGSVFGLAGAVRLIELLENGCCSYNAWVTMLDDNRKPNNGPFEASRTIITLNAITLTYDYHFDYYMYGQFMRYIPRGARRIATTFSPDRAKSLKAISFVNAAGARTQVLVNLAREYRQIQIQDGERLFPVRLPPESVVTLSWD
jgi:glucosylceramidase